MAFLATLESAQTFYPVRDCTPDQPGCRMFSLGTLAVADGALWYQGGVVPLGWEPDALGPFAEPWTTFQTPTPIDAFGVEYGPSYASPPIDFRFTIGGHGSGPSFVRQTSIVPVTGPTKFFGVISPTPFDRFTIEITGPTPPDNFYYAWRNGGFSAVTIGVPPEPATLALLATGVAGLLVVHRRRRPRR